jgi:hypothetical protein
MLSRALLVFAAAISPAYAAGDVEQLCAAGGYYTGAQDRFMSGLAAHVLTKRGELGTLTCSALWKNGYRVGEYFSKTGKPMAEDAKVFEAAGAFSQRVYTSIAKGAGY